ncbi:C-C motif chemokine 22 [Tupaia chinensis]|nr:C-C motif chemokine 22 [Tupaia chinensis]
MARLQSSLLAALIILAVVLPSTDAGPYGANVEDSVCCQNYARHALPSRAVKHFYWTSPSCRRPGVVLLTLRDWEICADPRQAWVKRIMKKLR